MSKKPRQKAAASEQEMESVLNALNNFPSALNSTEKFEEYYSLLTQNSSLLYQIISSDLVWFKPWKKIKEGKAFNSKWFSGGKTNFSFNCLDRHVNSSARNKAAIIWEGENGESEIFTYQILLSKVEQFANVLKNSGVKKGDVVMIYMGLIPALIISVLACARIGAIYSLVFAGYGKGAIRKRIECSKPNIIITADAAVRRGQIIPLKENLDAAAEGLDYVKKIIVFRRNPGHQVEMHAGRDFYWNELMSAASDTCDAEELEADHPLSLCFISTGKDEPVMVHHYTAGLMIQTLLSSKLIFDFKDNDILWCTVDTAWLSGLTFSVYTALLNGITSVIYEGVPNHPAPDRYWNIISKYKVNVFCTIPTFLRASNDWGMNWLNRHDLSSLRIITSIGELLNPELKQWYFKNIGIGKSKLIDCWYQTEAGCVLFASSATNLKECKDSFLKPLPAVDFEILNLQSNAVKDESYGYLVLKNSLPSMSDYFYSEKSINSNHTVGLFKNKFFINEIAQYQNNGLRIAGRSDQTAKIAGHRVSLNEIAKIIKSHPSSAEATVIAKPDKIKGYGLFAFVVLYDKQNESMLLKEELRDFVMNEIGAIAKPDEVKFIDAFPTKEILVDTETATEKRRIPDMKQLLTLALNSAEEPADELNHLEEMREKLLIHLIRLSAKV